MRGLLDIRWKLVMAVVGVSFVCLAILNLFNQRIMDNHTLDRGRELTVEAVRLQASRFDQIAAGIRTLLNVLSVRVVAELEYTEERGVEPDLARLADFMAANLNQGVNLRGLSLYLLPGMTEPTPETERFFNNNQSVFISFTREIGEQSQYLPPIPVERINLRPWWGEALEVSTGIVAEPLPNFHLVNGVRVTHAECSFFIPIRREGKAIGVVSATMCLNDFLAQIRTENTAAINESGMIVSPLGMVVGKPANLDVSSLLSGSISGELSRIRSQEHPEILETILAGGELRTTVDFGGSDTFIASAPIPTKGPLAKWSVMLFRPEADMMPGSNFSGQFYQFAVIAAVSLLLGYLASRLMSGTLTSTERWHRRVLNRIPVPLGILDAQSVWAYANPALAETLRLPDAKSMMIGKHCRDTMPPQGAHFIIETNRPEAEDIVTIELRANESRIHAVSSCRLVDANGKYLGRLVLGMDVTDTRTMRHTLALALSIARNLDARSDRIQAVAGSLSESAMQKSAAIEQITSTTQGIGDAAATYAAAARASHHQAENTHAASDRGATEATEAANAMTGVKDSGEKVRSIIKLIDGIAFQTNLLALNAAVEAARAGRHGRGFAIVAEEVRSLAGRSAKAARETAAMIEEMTTRIGDATGSIEQLQATLSAIRDSAEFLRKNSDEVARVADIQSQSVRQVHLSLEQISDSVHATISISQETENMAREISEQAATLHRLTDDSLPGDFGDGGNSLPEREQPLLPRSSKDHER